MGDRTFSAEDVIRIYEEFLTSAEQETVELFFLERPMAIEGFSVENLLILLERLLTILAGPRIGVLAAVFGSLTLAALNAAIAGLASSNAILRNILAAEEVDA